MLAEFMVLEKRKAGGTRRGGSSPRGEVGHSTCGKLGGEGLTLLRVLQRVDTQRVLSRRSKALQVVLHSVS